MEEILKDYKKDGLLLSDKEAEDIEKLCCRKMEIAKVENKEEYMPLLFRDMVKEHFMRAAINEIFLLRTIERRVEMMCMVCRQSPCHSRCPNAPEPVAKYECCECYEGIYEGDKYFDGPEGYICENCLDDKTAREVLELLDEQLKIA